jgi:hypothetical protein
MLMKMRGNAVCGVMLTLLLIGMSALTFNIQTVKGESTDRKVGVNVGYWIQYGFSVTWESDDPDATTPQYILDGQQLAYYSNVVQSVSGTNITFDRILHLQNGTEKFFTYWIDVATGGGSGYMSFISANLSAGDTIYAGIGGVGEMNETITRTYLGEPVEINHHNSTVSGAAYFLYTDFYWSRATGVLYELYWNHTTYATKGEETYTTRETQWHYPIGVAGVAGIRTVGALKAKIEELGFEGQIDNQGVVKSLIAKLNVAQKLVGKGKAGGAKGILADGFIRQVQNLSGICITADAADTLIQAAEYIRSHL